jgi:hypothetical protein
MAARTFQGMAPYPGQARCLALGFWPESFRRLNVKGGRRSFPNETQSALDIEGKHGTIQGAIPGPESNHNSWIFRLRKMLPSLLIRGLLCGWPGPVQSVRDLGRISARRPGFAVRPSVFAPGPGWRGGELLTANCVAHTAWSGPVRSLAE